MNTQTIFYALILDESGSMDSVRKPTLSGLNEQLQMIRSLQSRFPMQRYLVSLTKFSHEVRNVYRNQPAATLNAVSLSDYRPDGSTALWDAIGKTVGQIQEQAMGIENARVVVVILTDGEENASQSYTAGQISTMIRTLEATGQWTFSILGADIDARALADRMNIRRENTMAFKKEDMQDTFRKVSRSFAVFAEEAASGAPASFKLYDENDSE